MRTYDWETIYMPLQKILELLSGVTPSLITAEGTATDVSGGQEEEEEGVDGVLTGFVCQPDTS